MVGVVVVEVAVVGVVVSASTTTPRTSDNYEGARELHGSDDYEAQSFHFAKKSSVWGINEGDDDSGVPGELFKVEWQTKEKREGMVRVRERTEQEER